MKTTSSKHENESQKASGLRKAVSVAGICLVGWGLWETANLFIGYKGSETTDDAQVEQYLSPVNVRVPGYIHRICFTEHQYVHRGDTLLIIEDDEYRIRLKEAEAALLDARSGRKAMGHTLNTVTSTASVYEASIAEAQFRVEQLEKDYRRYSALLEKKATTPIIVEQYQTQLEMARERVKGLKQQQNAAFSSVTEVGQRQENAEAAVMRAEAAVEMARLNLSYTVVLTMIERVEILPYHTSQPVIYGRTHPLRRLSGTPLYGRRTVGRCRTNGYNHYSGNTEVDSGQLQRDTDCFALCRTRSGSNGRRV